MGLCCVSVHSSARGWFTFFSEPMSWNEAFTVCSDRGERLLHINNADKYSDVTDMINELTDQGYLTGPLWLGAYRTLGSTPTTMWTDCSLAQFTPWQNATYSADKLCAEVHGDTFAWQKCNVLHQFICEGHIDQCRYEKTSGHDLASGKGHSGTRVSSAVCGSYCMTYELHTAHFDLICAAYSFNNVTRECFVNMKPSLYEPDKSPSFAANTDMDVNVKRCFSLNISSSSAGRPDSRLMPENPCTSDEVFFSATSTTIFSNVTPLTHSTAVESSTTNAHSSILDTPSFDFSAMATVGVSDHIPTAVSVVGTTVQGLITVLNVDNSNVMSQVSESSDISPSFNIVFPSDNYASSLYSSTSHIWMTSSRYPPLSFPPPNTATEHETSTLSLSVPQMTQGTTKLPPLSQGDPKLISSAYSQQDVITTTTSGAFSDVPNNPSGTMLCTCHCRPSNITEERLRSIKQHLAVDRANLSTTRRRMMSAPDHRKSVTAVGCISVGVLCVLLLVLLALDVDQVLRLVTWCHYANPGTETGTCVGSGQTASSPVREGREHML
ncbi:uncharacterized protein [Haliotis cracherodii]|uniref:uncharacterized protein n=1 Tax=Haliotis cracherodii TaxID=6455 RepID=UPI0039E9A635